MRSQASSPANASSPAISSKVSQISASVIRDTLAPRFGEISIRFSAASTLNASRSGVREIPSVSHSSRSLSFMPGLSTPSVMNLRRCSTTVSCRRWRSSRGSSGVAPLSGSGSPSAEFCIQSPYP